MKFDIVGVGVLAIDDILYVSSYPKPDEKVPIRDTRRDCGGLIGTALAACPMAPPSRLFIAIFNAYCLYLSIGCLAYLVSAASNRRGRAIGLVFAVVTASFLINFLADFWKPAQHINFLSLLSYYRPFSVFQSGAWPLGDIAVLLGSALVFWLLAGIVFTRRDICTL